MAFDWEDHPPFFELPEIIAGIRSAGELKGDSDQLSHEGMGKPVRSYTINNVIFDFGESWNGKELGIRLPPEESAMVRKIIVAEGKTAIGIAKGFVRAGF